MKEELVMDKLLKLYYGLGWKSLFARIRLMDAPYNQTESLIQKNGTIVELGCGEGLFSNYLALKCEERKIIGIEIDKQRFKQANRNLKNTKFMFGDATRANIPKCDVIVMMHLLHHLHSFKDQEKLLTECIKKINKNGKIIIVEVDPRISIKYLFAFIADHFLVPWIFEKRLYSKIYFRKRKDWISLLNKLGFEVKAYAADKHMPFSHIIFECFTP